MDHADKRRLEHSEQVLAKGIAALPHDVANGLYWIKSSLLLKATTLFRASASDALVVVNQLVEEAARLHAEYNHPIAPGQQNDLVILALFAGNSSAATSLASLPATADDLNPFTLALKSHLALALGLSGEVDRSVQVSELEALLLADLRDIVDGKDTTLEGTHRFWSSLKKKRFANTIFEHTNIHLKALSFLRQSRPSPSS